MHAFDEGIRGGSPIPVLLAFSLHVSFPQGSVLSAVHCENGVQAEDLRCQAQGALSACAYASLRPEIVDSSVIPQIFVLWRKLVKSKRFMPW